MMASSTKVEEVDYILVSNKSLNRNEAADRKCFETGLKYKGLKISYEEIENQIFTKLSLPDKTKYKYFEILELRMPLKMEVISRFRSLSPDIEFDVMEGEMEFLSRLLKFFQVDRIQNVLKVLKNYFLHEDDDLTEIEKNNFFAPFKDQQRDLFELDNPYATKKIWNILIINYILSRQSCDGKSQSEMFTGIEAMIENKIFTAAFPLHDGTYEEEGTMRNKLYKLWNNLFFWKNLPPLDDMRDYFGNTCAVYFAWLEFYTKMLLPASVFGILLLVYGLITLPTDKFSNGVCSADNVTMCPVCDYICDYYPLSNNCMYAKVAHLFDNDFTIVYSTLMALWSSVLCGLWIRRNKVLQRKWNLLESVDEKSRVQYTMQLEIYRKVTGRYVDKIPLSMKLTALTLSSSIILFFIILVAIAIISITMYEIWVTGVVYSTNNVWLLSHGSFVISFTSSLLNLFTLTILNTVYSKVAVYLNDREFHRTRSQYDRALTVKNFAFQFINTYASVLYIALIKGKFIGFPGHYNRIFGYRQSECSYGGCLMELNIQLATIMIGQQIIESFVKLITTFFRVRLKRSGLFTNEETKENLPLSENVRTNNSGGKYYQTVKLTTSRWEEDNNLLDYEKEGGLFNEYLELAIQYGFVILFTPAFPLAPLFAWIRNIFEIRFDATKILVFYRRLVPYLNPNMIIWLEIFNFMGNISVLINAIVIAFSTNVITRLIYSLYNNGSDEGYLSSTLSVYNTSDLNRRSIPESSWNVTVCYYSDFREPFWSPHKYEHTSLYWHILVTKFIFIIFYQNVIFLFKNLILKWIPETPGRLHQFQKKERDHILSSLEPIDLDDEVQNQSENTEESRGTNTSNQDSDSMEKQLEDVTIIGIDRLQSFSREIK